MGCVVARGRDGCAQEAIGFCRWLLKKIRPAEAGRKVVEMG
jgi:hypothetical protein